MILKFRCIKIDGSTIDTYKTSDSIFMTGEQRLRTDRHFAKGDFIVITTVLGWTI